MEIQEQIQHNFTYHAPRGTQQERYERLRAKGKELALQMAADCPDSLERERALMNLEQAVMWANASIARSGV